MTHSSPGWSKAKNSFRVGHAFAQLNARVIDIDWAAESTTLRIIDKTGKTVIRHAIPFSELQFK
jgi:hypothetical protein